MYNSVWIVQYRIVDIIVKFSGDTAYSGACVRNLKQEKWLDKTNTYVISLAGIPDQPEWWSNSYNPRAHTGPIKWFIACQILSVLTQAC